MKTYAVLIGALGVVVSLAATKKFELQGAIVEYQVNGAGVKGTRTVAFDYTEKKVRIESRLEVRGKAAPEELILILRNDSIYQIKLTDKVYMDVTKTQQSEIPPWQESQIVFEDGKYLGDEIIKDKKCEVWSVAADKFWIHRGLILKKSTVESAGRTTVEATSVDIRLPGKEYFEIPKGFKQVEDPMSKFIDELLSDEPAPKEEQPKETPSNKSKKK